jgi:hypothetical protein
MGLEFGDPRRKANLILIRGSGLMGRNGGRVGLWAGMGWFMKGGGGMIGGNIAFYLGVGRARFFGRVV